VHTRIHIRLLIITQNDRTHLYKIKIQVTIRIKARE